MVRTLPPGGSSSFSASRSTGPSDQPSRRSAVSISTSHSSHIGTQGCDHAVTPTGSESTPAIRLKRSSPAATRAFVIGRGSGRARRGGADAEAAVDGKAQRRLGIDARLHGEGVEAGRLRRDLDAPRREVGVEDHCALDEPHDLRRKSTGGITGEEIGALDRARRSPPAPVTASGIAGGRRASACRRSDAARCVRRRSPRASAPSARSSAGSAAGRAATRAARVAPSSCRASRGPCAAGRP